MSYSLATVHHQGSLAPVLETDGNYWLLDAVAPSLISSPERGLLDVFEKWDEASGKLEHIVSSLSKGTLEASPIEQPSKDAFAAPILYPSKILCCGANYYDHIEKDMGITDFDKEKLDPLFFLKHSRALVGSGPSVRFPIQSKQLDWEIELVVVIGRRAKRISRDRAMDCVAGYSVGLDLSARDWQFNPRHLQKFDLFAGKAFDDSSPLGPGIVPAKLVNPADLSLKLWVNSELKQDSNTRQMIWSIAEQIEAVTKHVTLEPGDVLYTGSPSGVGLASQTYLNEGDRIDAEIGEVGRLSVRLVPESE
jgi:2-keto-4-pentenoate hydratase/2-oxohepta-3-ene-1,7-dioic acid hydratase in catechol pathway